MAALMAREQSGQGRHVDVSVQACMASIHQFTINCYVYVGRIQKRLGNRYQRAHPITIYPCKDGLVCRGDLGSVFSDAMYDQAGIAMAHRPHKSHEKGPPNPSLRARGRWIPAPVQAGGRLCAGMTLRGYHIGFTDH